MNQLTPASPPTRLLRSLALVARWSLALLLFAWLLFIASWSALHILIVPRIGELRPQLEATVSRLTGIPIRIESITAYSTNLLPAFELGNVRLMDDQGREALRLPTVLVSMSPRSLLALKFDQILIERPVLEVRRSADGRIRVAGLDLSQGETDVALLDRIFSQPEFVIRRGSVVWTDELRGVAPLTLRDVDVVLRNRSRLHEFRLDATPPPDWGDRFGLMARFEQPFLSRGNGLWAKWWGQVYADFSRVDVAQLKRYADVGVDVEQGRGAVRAWVDIQRASVIAATADVVLADVSVRVNTDLAPLRMASLSGRLSARFTPDGFEFETRDLAFDTADAIRWPGGNLTLKQHDAGTGSGAAGELLADRLDLAALVQVAKRLPLGATLHKALARHRPSGLVERVKVSWRGPVDAPERYQVQGRVARFAVVSYPDDTGAKPGTNASIGTPGIRGATVDFALTESGGKATLSINNGSIDFPGVFDEPVVPFRRLSTEMAWQLDRDQVQVQLNNLRFSNPDADGELQLKWQTSDPRRASSGARFPGVLDLQGTLSRANATRVHRYLPLVVEASVRQYVRDAVQGGSSAAVRFKVKGDLWDVPYAHSNQGEFLISAPITGATLAYVPQRLQAADARPWPALTRLSGELVIDRHSLMVNGAGASLDGLPGLQITNAAAVIADMMQSSVVAVNLESRGPLSDLLAFVRASPLDAMMDQSLARITGSGGAELRLKLSVPLNDPDRTTTQGALMLLGNDIQVAPDIPRLLRSRGTVSFTESGFSVQGVQARLLGGDVRLDGGSIPPSAAPAGVVRAGLAMGFRLQGVASADALRQARELGAAARLAQHAGGSAAYAATITLRAGVPEFAISSSLAGMSLNLPAPLGKSAEATLPMRLESSPLRDPATGNGAATRLQDQLLLDLGRIGSVRYERDLSSGEPRVLRGTIAVGLAADEVAPMPREGVFANIRLGDVDLDLWQRLFAQLTGTAPSAGLSDPAPQSELGGAVREYLPSTLALRAGSLTAGGRTLNDLVAGGWRDGQIWRANLDARQLGGHVEYRQPTGAGAGRLYARLSRLTLAQSSASAVESLLVEQPQSIPALDIVVDELELRGKKLGRVEIEAINRAIAGRAGSAREWRLNRFDVITPEAVFRATGNWAAVDPQAAAVAIPRSRSEPVVERRRTAIQFRLDIRDSGELLARLEMKDVVRRGKGHMEGQVAWAGSPLSLDYGSLSGSFIVNIENGQFLKAEPGLAKLLGVLSLQSLPRRLVLDFRDVFSEGFAFDFFRGDVRIDQGIAYSSNLQMKGIHAAVLMEGQADLSLETQDIRVVVVPEINTGTASLIAAAINPALGLGSFLAQFVLRRPLMEAATQEFHVDGSWLEPRIQRTDLKTAPAGDGERSPRPADTK